MKPLRTKVSDMRDSITGKERTMGERFAPRLWRAMKTPLGTKLAAIRERIARYNHPLSWADVQREVRDRQVGGE